MPGTPSGRQVNWDPVTWTPAGGSILTFNGITGIDIDPNGNLLKFSGDGDRYPTTVINDFIDNMVTITLANLVQARTVGPGSRGAWAGTHLDAKGQGAGTTAGNMLYAMANSVVQNNPTGGQHRQYGQARILICAESTDGVTNPLATTVAT